MGKKKSKGSQKEQTARQLDEQLLLAASRGDVSEVNACLEKGANVNTRDEYGFSALNEAARGGHTEVIKRLVQAGADVESTSKTDTTPLMNAATAGHFEAVKFLLAEGARVSHDLLSSVQLKINILQENAEIGMVRPEAAGAWLWLLKLLQVAQIRQVKPKTEDLSAPEAQLLKAAHEGNPADLKTALQAGGDVNVSDGQDISALRWAVQSGRPEAVELLLDAGADIDQQSASGWTALMQAVFAESAEIASLLIERGADLDARTFADASALYFARDIVPLSTDQEAARQIVNLLEARGAEYSAPPEN